MTFDRSFSWREFDVLPVLQINRYTEFCGEYFWDVVLAWGPAQLIIRW